MSVGTPFVQRLDALLERDAVLEHGLLNAASDEIERLRSELSAARSAALEEAAKVAQDDTSFMMLQDFGMQQTCTQVRENIAAAIRELKGPQAP